QEPEPGHRVAQAVSAFVGLVPHYARVGHRDRHAVANDCRAHANDSALWQSGHAMLDGVFNEGLNEHRRDPGFERSWIEHALETQTMLEAHALERHVLIDDRQFLREAHR